MLKLSKLGTTRFAGTASFIKMPPLKKLAGTVVNLVNLAPRNSARTLLATGSSTNYELPRAARLQKLAKTPRQAGAAGPRAKFRKMCTQHQ